MNDKTKKPETEEETDQTVIYRRGRELAVTFDLTLPRHMTAMEINGWLCSRLQSDGAVINKVLVSEKI